MSSKQWIGGAVALFWLVMMGLLWQREMGGRRLVLPPASAAAALEPSESWLSLSLATGERVGQVHMQNGPEERQGVLGSRLDLTAEMYLNLLGKATDLSLAGHVWRPVEEKRVQFELAIQSADHDFQVSGRVAEGRLRGEIRSAGEVLPLELPMSEDLLMSSGIGAALHFPVLQVGDEILLDSFDPLTLSRGTARVRCEAEETLTLAGQPVESRRLRVRMSGMESLAWVDARGEVVRAETPFGWVLERSTAAELQTAGTPLPEAGELLALTSIQPTGARPFRGAQEMTLRLSGVDALWQRTGQDAAALALPSDGAQQVLEGNKVRLLAVVEAGDVTGDPAPFDASPYLRADAFVQSDHATLRAHAATVTEGVEGAWEQALRLHDWVFAHIDKEAVLTIPSALEVLAKRRGDCNEHTVLFAALARALEIPTKIAIGVVWSDELDGFYYHAWPEVHIDGRWHRMDPTLDQPQADATHLKLLEGGIETWPRLMPYLGQLEIEVLSVG